MAEYVTTYEDHAPHSDAPDPQLPDQPAKPSDEPSRRKVEWTLINSAAVYIPGTQAHPDAMIRYTWTWRAR